MKAAIADVVTGSAKVEQLVAKNAADADVHAALHDVHECFEVVEKGCKPAKHHWVRRFYQLATLTSGPGRFSAAPPVEPA